jgi:hypothetical protein
VLLRWSNKRHRLLLQWTIASGAALLVVLAAVLLLRPDAPVTADPGAPIEGLTSVLTRQHDQGSSPLSFVDVTASSGIAFRHFPDERASMLPEDMGSGVAMGDFDDDGLVDLFFVNFAASIIKPPIDATAGRCRLYRNLGQMRFVDVTDSAGLELIAFAMAAASGDYDNDGDLDLYVTTFGDNILYENRGVDGFRDVTAQAGVGDARFSAGCSWADYDRDGDLDLYVCNYVDFVFRAADQSVTQKQYGTEQPYTLNPSSYAPQSNSLFRNRGDGTFEEVALTAGVADPKGRSLSASWFDMNNDGWPDLYVANDVSNNGVFLNKTDGTFENVGPSSLAADYRGAMGLAVVDLDDDLDQDLLVTHWIAQENALFVNRFNQQSDDPSAGPRLWFLDSADAVGLGQISIDAVGWATGFCDFDNDGRRDVWVVNGSTFEQPANHRLLRPQRPFVFYHRGVDDFVEVAAEACARFADPFVGRGGAQGDLNQDGLVDLVWLVHSGEAIILRNNAQQTGHWLSINLLQNGGNRFAIGAKVYLTTAASTQMATVGSSSSYLSQHAPALHFGLGTATTIESIRIVWPDGIEETHPAPQVDQFVTYLHEAHYPPPPG